MITQGCYITADKRVVFVTQFTTKYTAKYPYQILLYLQDFLNLNRNYLKFKKFPYYAYIKCTFKVTVICKNIVKSYIIFTSSTSRKIKDFSDFQHAIEQIYNELEKLSESIVFESGCEIAELTLLDVQVGQWLSRKLISEIYNIPVSEIEIFITPKAIGFRNIKTKRFIRVIRIT